MRPVAPADLASFLAIARHKSFRRAADELGCTPSALSHALRSIEERLDLRLVNRTTRSVALTEAGEQLFELVSPAFRDIDDALDDLNNFRGQPMGALRFNAARGAAEMVLLPMVTRFLAQQPGVKVEIIADSALVDMVAEGCDAGIRFGETIAQDMVAVPIGGRQRTAIVASPAFFEKYPKPTTPEQLKEIPCIRYRFASGRFYAWEFERGGVELNIEVDGPLALNDQQLTIQAALDGIGATFAFEEQVTDLIAAGKLVRVLEDWCPYYGGFYLYYPSRRRAPAPLRAFIDFIREGG
ncbi:LysR family transcriptional regulator [Caulobacter sp.]|uniref:LysR family transcriptional regulator n=1 Tax=Caulobacter sp. TaxID=78 RepID=UPI001B0C21C2|nr:LysR family transcriptional regulator [Caulobacter sp.]MBO9545867.1 LysR family transcriptional regulator [Caulobacter sp.]